MKFVDVFKNIQQSYAGKEGLQSFSCFYRIFLSSEIDSQNNTHNSNYSTGKNFGLMSSSPKFDIEYWSSWENCVSWKKTWQIYYQNHYLTQSKWHANDRKDFSSIGCPLKLYGKGSVKGFPVKVRHSLFEPFNSGL